jgi:phosphoribosyl 1,2-cyclic phosphodiesterase
MYSQVRGTGGFFLDLAGQVIHIDPGPGALVRARERRINLKRLSAVIVSHYHQDHVSDAAVMIEAMTNAATERGGAFLSNDAVINGNKEHPPLLDRFHMGLLRRIEIMKPGDRISLGKVRVTATPTEHREESGLGFLFEGEGLRIGYTGDGEYFPGMEKHFQRCDYLIINTMRPRTDAWPGHMNAGMARELVSRARPGKAILTHFGMKMLKGVAEREAAWIERETGVKTMAARDGLTVSQRTPGKKS